MRRTLLCGLLLGLGLGLAPGAGASVAAGVAGDPADRPAQLRRLAVAVAHAESLADRGDPAAEARFREAVRAAEPLGKTVLLARALAGLADATREAGRYDEAAALYEGVIPLWEQLLGTRQPRLAVSLHNLGAVRLEQGRTEAAADLFRRAMDVWAATLGADSPQAENTRRALRVAASQRP